MTEPRAPSLQRIVTGLGITQIVGWGTTFYIPAVLSGRIAEDTGWSVTAFVGAFSWCMLVSGLLSKRIGALLDAHGARKVMSWGSVALALGLLIVATATHEIQLFLGWTVIGIGMRAALYDAAFTALAHIAGTRARRSISIVTLWGGLASTFFWPIAHLLDGQFGWRITLGIYVLANLVICLPIHRRLPTHNPAPSPDASTAPGPASVSGAQPGRLQGAARERAVVMLSAIFAGHALVWSSLSANMIGLLTDLGVTAGVAVTLSTAIGIAQVASRLLEMLAQGRLAPMATGVAAMSMLVFALAVFRIGPEGALPIALACVIYGAANGLVTIVRGALPLVVFGNQNYGTILGRIAAPGLICSAIAPVLFAWVLERLGTPASLTILVGICATSLAGMLWIAWHSRSTHTA
jgi:MFS family permease